MPEVARDPISQDFYLRQKAREVQQSVKEQEANFGKGLAKGVAVGTVEGLGGAIDFLNSLTVGHLGIKTDFQGQAHKFMTGLLAPTPAPGEQAGLEAGNVTSNFLDPQAVVGKAGILAGIGKDTPAIKKAMELARNALDDGKTAMQVWKESGWFNLNHGVANAPVDMARYLDTSQMFLDPAASKLLLAGNEMAFNKAVRGIPDILHADNYESLFDNYKIIIDDLPSGISGMHNAKAMTLTINKNLVDSSGKLTKEGLNTLNHEMQHAVQLYEGWLGKGSNTAYGAPAHRVFADMGKEAVEQWTKGRDGTLENINKVIETKYGDDVREIQLANHDLVAAADNQSSIFGALQQERKKPRTPQAVIDSLGAGLREAAMRHRNALKKVQTLEDALVKKAKASKPTDKEIERLEGAGVILPNWLKRGTLPASDPSEPWLAKAASFSPEQKIIYEFYRDDIGEAWARVAGNTQGVSAEEMAKSAPWRWLDSAPNKMVSRVPGIGAWKVK